MDAEGDFTCSVEVNSACTEALNTGQNTCAAQARRRLEGRTSRAVNIQIDLAFQAGDYMLYCPWTHE